MIQETEDDSKEPFSIKNKQNKQEQSASFSQIAGNNIFEWKLLHYDLQLLTVL